MAIVLWELARLVAIGYAGFMLQADVIEKMSVSERLETMEQLWDSIARDESKVASPAWHGQVLAERKARVERGEAKFLTLDQLRTYLREHK